MEVFHGDKPFPQLAELLDAVENSLFPVAMLELATTVIAICGVRDHPTVFTDVFASP